MIVEKVLYKKNKLKIKLKASFSSKLTSSNFQALAKLVICQLYEKSYQ